MFSPRQLQDMLLLDIETASATPDYASLPPRMQALWDIKAARLGRPDDAPKSPAAWYEDRAGIFAEFARVVCISCGNLRFGPEGLPELKVKSFCGTDERALLAELAQSLDKFFLRDGRPAEGRTLCAHNGKEFDFPFLGRRFVVHQLPLPQVLQTQGKKPWETSFVDTMELWKFGDYKAFTSLDLLTAVLDIPSPKDDMDGSEVGRVFWQQGDLPRIQHYCEKDVRATAQVLLRMSRLPLIPD